VVLIDFKRLNSLIEGKAGMLQKKSEGDVSGVSIIQGRKLTRKGGNELKRIAWLTIIFMFLSLLLSSSKQKDIKKENWFVHPNFKELQPGVIAVVPMINMSLEKDVGKILQKQVYDSLQSKGYQRISAEVVDKAMKKLGIQTPEMLAGISYMRLGKELNCDAVIQGEVNQSGTQHKGVYDSIVVTISLRLVDCKTGKILWQGEQWRTAHRQWQADPLNLVINLIAHEKGNRKKRIAWLVQEMLRTLPEGKVSVIIGEDLLSKAVEVDTTEPLKKEETEGEKDKIKVPLSLSASVFFDSDSCELNDDIRKTLENVVPVIETYENAEIMIYGYTDSPGSDIHDKNLPLNRAKACENWFRQNVTLKNQRFVVKVLESKNPITPDADDDDDDDVEKTRRRNVRVEIIIKKNE
jgi:outer membrane protein OmpA-like peptidoglycan-associated protein